MRSKSVKLMNDIIDYVNNVYSLTGRTPSYREIASHFSITSACVSNYIKDMAKRNMISNTSKVHGLITEKMRKSTYGTTSIPVIGSISCGLPIFAEENIECYLPIPTSFVGSGKFFILRANGDSMIEASINDGDYVIVKQQEFAEEGQIVVALIDDSATLKRYYIDNKKKLIRLHPENSSMEDQYYDHIQIQGVAVKVIKDLL